MWPIPLCSTTLTRQTIRPIDLHVTAEIIFKKVSILVGKTKIFWKLVEHFTSLTVQGTMTPCSLHDTSYSKCYLFITHPFQFSLWDVHLTMLNESNGQTHWMCIQQCWIKKPSNPWDLYSTSSNVLKMQSDPWDS